MTTQELEIQACPLVTNGGLLDLTSRCHHLNHLDVQVGIVVKLKTLELPVNETTARNVFPSI